MNGITFDELEFKVVNVHTKLEIKLKEINQSDYSNLYELMNERDESINISHKVMPTYVEHCTFWSNKPYPWMKIILIEDKFVGYCYLTNKNEIGIFIKKEHHNKGVGSLVLELITKIFRKIHPTKRLLANINPKNTKSQNLFKKFGFEPIQYTYELP